MANASRVLGGDGTRSEGTSTEGLQKSTFVPNMARNYARHVPHVAWAFPAGQAVI